MCTNSQSSHGGSPENFRPRMFATAEARPIVASIPLSR